MLICEVMAFLSRIANSNICHFVKQAAMVTISGGLSLSLCPSATMAAKCNMLLLICNNT